MRRSGRVQAAPEEGTADIESATSDGHGKLHTPPRTARRALQLVCAIALVIAGVCVVVVRQEGGETPGPVLNDASLAVAGSNAGVASVVSDTMAHTGSKGATDDANKRRAKALAVLQRTGPLSFDELQQLGVDATELAAAFAQGDAAAVHSSESEGGSAGVDSSTACDCPPVPTAAAAEAGPRVDGAAHATDSYYGLSSLPPGW